MTSHGAQPNRSKTIAVEDAIQAYADDTKRERKQSPTYRSSRLKILGAIGVAGVLAAFGVAHFTGGEDVDAAANNSVSGGDKAASAPANPNKSAGALSFECALNGITLDTASVGADGAKIKLGVKSSGRDNVTYVAPAYIEGAFGGEEAPMIGDGGAGESSTIVQVPPSLFNKTIGVYALSGEGDSVRCGAFEYEPNPEDPNTPSAHFESDAALPPTFQR